MSEATANLCTTDAAEAMRVTIDEQAREIELWSNRAHAEAMLVVERDAEIAALSAKP